MTPRENTAGYEKDLIGTLLLEDDELVGRGDESFSIKKNEAPLILHRQRSSSEKMQSSAAIITDQN